MDNRNEFRTRIICIVVIMRDGFHEVSFIILIYQIQFGVFFGEHLMPIVDLGK